MKGIFDSALIFLDGCTDLRMTRFLLYAALHSGVHCNFLSRDLMRDHKACLSDSTARRLFFKWQRGHQLVISHYVPGKRVRFQVGLWMERSYTIKIIRMTVGCALCFSEDLGLWHHRSDVWQLLAHSLWWE